MRLLLDSNVDRRFGALLFGHEAVHARQMGWGELQNGELIAAAESAGFSALITADKSMRYQQSLKGRAISIITLNPILVDFEGITPLAPKVLAELNALTPGAFVTLTPDRT
ncbi:MAG TPA: DUF5615 family PIN-like protein [Fimbriimonadaceae bacterium]|nr:DUF5615 family PIN-like protein [Fimbriimonadaceae bacterium]